MGILKIFMFYNCDSNINMEWRHPRMERFWFHSVIFVCQANNGSVVLVGSCQLDINLSRKRESLLQKFSH